MLEPSGNPDIHYTEKNNKTASKIRGIESGGRVMRSYEEKYLSSGIEVPRTSAEGQTLPRKERGEGEREREWGSMFI